MQFRGLEKYNLEVRTNPISGDYVLRKLNPSEPNVSANAVPSARNARSKTSDKAPSARAAKHSKAVVEEPLPAPSEAAVERVAAFVADQPEVPKAVSTEEIAKLAYCYWADRGYQGGDPKEDWVRAEKALLS